eukprot:CAMPEP_0114538216 /NCGR_PEP_ID=MMETSP0109-20121206/30013_1 /TAXON_ID=29199 /ORGANISM="Chlorarachnion reptans, Strain CCCM449" /LENGTH=186 /DNA_ID=CAMNT_0001722197 /DNA_START=109 /DNA_END=670 /DNA_ORIENTATION=-
MRCKDGSAAVGGKRGDSTTFPGIQRALALRTRVLSRSQELLWWTAKDKLSLLKSKARSKTASEDTDASDAAGKSGTMEIMRNCKESANLVKETRSKFAIIEAAFDLSSRLQDPNTLKMEQFRNRPDDAQKRRACQLDLDSRTLMDHQKFEELFSRPKTLRTLNETPQSKNFPGGLWLRMDAGKAPG